MELKNVRGTFDFLPKEQIVRNYIINNLSSVFQSYGYLPLETSTLCYFDLLSSKYAGGAEILKEVYCLKDQGNRELGLRYDLTVPFSKVIAMNKDLVLPFRRYEIGKVYRDGPVKAGRNREFYQCDVDVCGIAGSLVEAELMLMAKEGFGKLGIDIFIEWNNRKFLAGMIIEAGIASDLVNKTILVVDKLAKIGEDGVFKELEEYNIARKSLEKLFAYFKEDILVLEETFANSNNELLKEGISEVKELNAYLNKLGLNCCKFTPYLARGLEIYTGTVWEVFDAAGRLTCAIGAGGRYDKIITNFIDDGKEYPAVGMSFGLVPIYDILMQDKNKGDKPLYDLYLIPLDTEIETLKLATLLRNRGIKVLVEMNKKKVKKAFDWANRNNVPYVSVVGDEEIKNGKIQIKNMNLGESIEKQIDNIDDICEIFKK